MPRPNRRAMICEAALDLAAAGGNHAVTHQAVDRRLSLPKGSTSYYFRTREALISAASWRLVERSRSAFGELLAAAPGPGPEVLIADYLDELITSRRRDVLARHALVQDPSVSPSAHDALARCLFSAEAATDLMRARSAGEPEAAAAALIVLLEGIVFTYTHGMQRDHGRSRGALSGQLSSLIAGSLGNGSRGTR